MAILCAMERPHFFTGIVLSAPAILANPETATRCMVIKNVIASPHCLALNVHVKHMDILVMLTVVKL